VQVSGQKSNKLQNFLCDHKAMETRGIWWAKKEFWFKLNKALQKFTGIEAVPDNITYV